MRALLRPLPLLVPSFLVLAACAGAGEAPSTAPAATASASPAPSELPLAPTADTPPPLPAEPTATGSAGAGPLIPPSPATSTYADLAVTPGDAQLEPAAGYLKAGENARARAELAKVVPQVDASGTLEAQLAGHTMLGRACDRLGDGKCASAHYKIVRDLWRDPKAAAATLDAIGGDDTERVRRLGRALNAVGEALFYAAEEKRQLADQEKFPVYKGSGKREDVLRHIQKKIAPWLTARRARVEDAEKAYIEILALAPVPPPRWVVSAAARTGAMWLKLATEVRGAPMPDEWKQDGPVPGTTGLTWADARKGYQEAIEEAVAPTMQTVRAVYKKCAALSVKYAYKDALSRECDDWLAANPDPAQTP